MFYFPSFQDPIVGQLGANLGQPRKYPANTGKYFKRFILFLLGLIWITISKHANYHVYIRLANPFLFWQKSPNFMSPEYWKGSLMKVAVWNQKRLEHSIYIQVFFESYSEAPEYHNRVALAVNGVTFSIMQTGLGGKADYGSLTTGGVIYLQKGDYISLVALYDSHILMQGDHTFLELLESVNDSDASKVKAIQTDVSNKISIFHIPIKQLKIWS